VRQASGSRTPGKTAASKARSNGKPSLTVREGSPAKEETQLEHLKSIQEISHEFMQKAQIANQEA
jgi:hypothetical protein